MSECRCECGYRCGGPGSCELSPLKCLEQSDGNHFVRDCDHDFSGELVMSDDGLSGSVKCQGCGLSADSHDCAVGP